jgi:hypothetical protein
LDVLLCTLKLLDDIFSLPLENEDLGLPLSYLKSIHSVLLVELDKSLLKLDDFLIGQSDLSHDGLLLFHVLDTRIALAVAKA